MQLIEVDLPEYKIEIEPDSKSIGKKVDDALRSHFLGKEVVVRGVASSEHAGKSVDDLVEIIKNTGTDRYDPTIKGDRYENVEGKHIDLFGVPSVVSDDSVIFETIAYGFWHSAIGIHGRPMRIDVVTIYDATKLEQVKHRYEGRDDIKEDGFAFKDPDQKAGVVLGIIKLN